MEKSQGLRPGAFLRHGTYRIERVLGQGGFGITYLATDTALEKKVAIKEFFPKDYCDRESTTSHVTLGTQSANEFVNKLKAKFLKEARNIAKFDYSGIIKIHAAFEENNTAYYVMDYIEGMSLSEMVKRYGPLSEDRALEYIIKVGHALEYVHSNKINHLDVKPANIMVRRSDNMPILIDFGLSKQYDSEGNQTSTTPTGISHGYAPIEQYNDGGVKEFSPQTDLYSLAATLYYILSGVTPPQATKLFEDELTFPVTIPTNLIPVISKAMASGRKNRHKSISEFINDINGGNEETKIKSTPKQEPVKKSAEQSSSKLKWIIISIVITILVAIAIWYNNTNNDSDSLNEVTDYPVMANDGSVIYQWTGKLTGDNMPTGNGVAKFSTNDKRGRKEYHGEMNNGLCESSNALLLYQNGSKYEGAFVAGERTEGKLTLPQDEMYYTGTFKNSKEYNGKWYFISTNAVYSEVINGKEIIK